MSNPVQYFTINQQASAEYKDRNSKFIAYAFPFPDKNDLKKLSTHAVRSNVFSSVNQLRHGSAVLESLIEKGKLIVVGAEYSLETGEVTFLDF